MRVDAEAEERWALAELGYALVREGRLHDARAIWEGLLAIDPTDEAPWRALAVIALREGRWEDVAELASGALERAPSPAVWLLRAEALCRTGRYADAARDLEQVARAPERDEVDRALKRRAAAVHARLRRPASGRL